MSITRLQLRNKVIANLGNRTDKNTVIDTGLNYGLQRAKSAYDFRLGQVEENFDIDSSDTYITLSSDLPKVMEARLINGNNSYSISFVPKQDLVLIYPNVSSDAKGQPSYAYIEGNKIYLYPLPDGDYTIRVTYYGSNSFDNDSSILYIPELEEALVCFATAYTMRNLQMFEFASVWDAEWEKAFMIARAANKRSPEVKRFKINETETTNKLDINVSASGDSDAPFMSYFNG